MLAAPDIQQLKEEKDMDSNITLQFYSFMKGVTIHPCPDLNDGEAEPPLKLGMDK